MTGSALVEVLKEKGLAKARVGLVRLESRRRGHRRILSLQNMVSCSQELPGRPYLAPCPRPTRPRWDPAVAWGPTR